LRTISQNRLFSSSVSHIPIVEKLIDKDDEELAAKEWFIF
jgi:hypothetical protein